MPAAASIFLLLGRAPKLRKGSGYSLQVLAPRASGLRAFRCYPSRKRHPNATATLSNQKNIHPSTQPQHFIGIVNIPNPGNTFSPPFAAITKG